MFSTLLFLVFAVALGAVPVTIRSYAVDTFWFKHHLYIEYWFKLCPDLLLRLIYFLCIYHVLVNTFY